MTVPLEKDYKKKSVHEDYWHRFIFLYFTKIVLLFYKGNTIYSCNEILAKKCITFLVNTGKQIQIKTKKLPEKKNWKNHRKNQQKLSKNINI